MFMESPSAGWDNGVQQRNKTNFRFNWFIRSLYAATRIDGTSLQDRSDRLCAELFKESFDIISPFLLKLYNRLFSNGEYRRL